MKTSNKILWGSLISIFGICIIFLIALRLTLSGDMEAAGESKPKAAMASRSIAIKDFIGIDLQGHWKAKVIQSDTAQITVKGPEDLLDSLSTNRFGDTLKLKMAEDSRNKRRLHLTVTMPKLHTFQT